MAESHSKDLRVEQEARAEAEKHFDGTYGPHWRQWPDDQQENSISDYAQGYIAGASRPAPPALPEAVSREELAWFLRNECNMYIATARDLADTLLAAFTITEKGDDR